MLLLIISFYWKGGKDRLRQTMAKLLIFGLVITAVVPLSTLISKSIDASYQDSIDQTIVDAKEKTDQLNVLSGNETEASPETEESAESETEKKTLWDSFTGTMSDAASAAGDTIETIGEAATSAVSSITNGAKKLVDETRDVLNDMVNAIVVLLVTSCLIPIAVLLFLIWITRILFRVDLPVPRMRRGMMRGTLGSVKKIRDGQPQHHNE